ncbi:MAG: hypothetical protein ACI8WB_003003 [Phenylobacterium sp.]|jgi:hypothetical protein
MTNQKDSGEARQALDSIEKMGQAALQRAAPPRWFNGAIALLAGVMVGLAVANLREYQVLVIVSMALVIAYQGQKVGVSMKKPPLKLIGVALVILGPLYFVLIIAAQYFQPVLGDVWAPILAGLLLTGAVFTLGIFERRWHHVLPNVGDGEKQQ